METSFVYLLAVMAASAIGMCLFLFVALKMEIQKIDRRSAETAKALRERLIDVEEAAMAATGARLRQIAATGIDVQQRTQVLRLARRGDDPDRIAAALGLPANEVNLLVKVQRAIAG